LNRKYSRIGRVKTVTFDFLQKSRKDFTLWALPEESIGKALKGEAVVNLLQILDNAANGFLREREISGLKDVGICMHSRL